MKFRMRVVDTEHDCLMTVGRGRQPQVKSEFPVDCWSKHFHLLGSRSRLGEGMGKTSLYRRQRYAQDAASQLCSRSSRIKEHALRRRP